MAVIDHLFKTSPFPSLPNKRPHPWPPLAFLLLSGAGGCFAAPIRGASYSGPRLSTSLTVLGWMRTTDSQVLQQAGLPKVAYQAALTMFTAYR
jgi:hypothetical protein